MNRNRRKHHIVIQRRKRVLSVITSFLIALIIGLNMNTVLALEETDIKAQPCYISIEIEHGETLWMIAERYKPAKQSTASYIAQLKQINGFGADDIYEGDYLIVADYTL